MIQQSAAASAAYRNYGDFPDNTGDWSILIRFKYNAAVAGFAQILNIFDGATDFSDPYIYLGSNSAANDVFLEYYDGTVFHDTSSNPITLNAQNWAAITYDASATSLSLTLNGVAVGSLTVNLSSRVWDSIYVIGAPGAGGDPTSAGYFRAWSALRTLAELIVEAANITPVISTGIIWDNPLQTSVDLTDHNGGLNQLVGLGTVTTDLTDPLLATVAGPPTNVSPATATTITLNSAVFQDTLTAGAATDIWFKYQSVADDNVLGLIAFGDLVTYKPRINVYGSLADANADIEYEVAATGLETTQNCPIQFPVNPALTTFYFKVLRNAAVTPATLQLSLIRALNLTVPIGSIGINEDLAQGLPVAFLDVNTGYPINFVQNWPGGEGGCTLSNGNTIFGLKKTGVYKIFNPGLTLISTITLTAGYEWASGNQIDKFVVANHATPPVARIIAADGTLDTTVYTLAGADCQSIGLSPDGSIIYYTNGNAAATNQPIHRWDTVTNTAMSDLVAGIANYCPNKNEIIVMKDGTIIAAYIKFSATVDYKIIHYSAAGAVLNTYNFGTLENVQNRIAGALDDPINFWTWIKVPPGFDGIDFLKKIRVSDGVVLSTLRTEEYSYCQYQLPANNTPHRFGNADSCPFWITRSVLFPGGTAKSGLYYIDDGRFSGTGVRKTNDTLWLDVSAGTTENVTIPNPFVEGYTAGDI